MVQREIREERKNRKRNDLYTRKHEISDCTTDECPCDDAYRQQHCDSTKPQEVLSGRDGADLFFTKLVMVFGCNHDQLLSVLLIVPTCGNSLGNDDIKTCRKRLHGDISSRVATA